MEAGRTAACAVCGCNNNCVPGDLPRIGALLYWNPPERADRAPQEDFLLIKKPAAGRKLFSYILPILFAFSDRI